MTIDIIAARAKADKATVDRRWQSKAELVLEALACLQGTTWPRTLRPTRAPSAGTSSR